MDRAILLEKISERLAEIKISEQKASVLVFDKADTIRNWRRGSDPGFSKVTKMCEFLGIPLTFDSAATQPDLATPVPGDTASLPIVISNNETSTLEIGELRNQLARLQTDLVDKLSETAAAVESLTVTPANDDQRDNAHPVPVVEVASAAGAGSIIDMEAVTGHVWFRRRWMSDHAIDPKQCAIIGVKGDSMYPTLVDGCSILVD